MHVFIPAKENRGTWNHFGPARLLMGLEALLVTYTTADTSMVLLYDAPELNVINLYILVPVVEKKLFSNLFLSEYG